MAQLHSGPYGSQCLHPIPLPPQLILNGDWAKTLFSFDSRAFSETLPRVQMNHVRQLFGFDLPSDEAF